MPSTSGRGRSTAKTDAWEVVRALPQAGRMRAPRASATHDVTIVSSNPETLDGLQTYLRGAGVAARCTRDLGDCANSAMNTLAFVLFPDDFRWEHVLATLAELAERRPRALPVLVTAQPQRYGELTPGRKRPHRSAPCMGMDHPRGDSRSSRRTGDSMTAPVDSRLASTTPPTSEPS